MQCKSSVLAGSQLSVWSLGLVEEANSGREETVFVACGIGPDGPQPSAGGEQLEQGVSRVGGVGHNLSRSPQGPRGVQVLEGRQIAANHLLLSSADDTLQPALVLGSGSSVPDGDGGGEDGLNDG